MYLAGVMLSYSLVAVQAVVWHRGHMRMSPVEAVQMPWDIARCMLTVVHCNAGICMSGVVSHLCTVHGCTIAGGCIGSCTVPVWKGKWMHLSTFPFRGPSLVKHIISGIFILFLFFLHSRHFLLVS